MRKRNKVATTLPKVIKQNARRLNKRLASWWRHQIIKPVTRFIASQKPEFDRGYQISFELLYPKKTAIQFLTLVLGINFLVASQVYLWHRRTVLSFAAQPVIVTDRILASPLQIKIPSAAIELPITPSEISNNVWQTSDTSVSHLLSSARPGEASNIVMYGHNRKKLLGSLDQVSIGDEIIVTTSDNKHHVYKVAKVQVVKPTDIQLVLPTDSELLTLYTCTGFLDSQRLVVQALPEMVTTQAVSTN